MPLYLGTEKCGGVAITFEGQSLPTEDKTVTPSTSAQVITPSPGHTLGSVTVNAMPSGSAGTPSASKGSVSNHSISITPSVTNTTGYITGGTKTGTAVTVSASELVSGSETKTENGTYDVTNLASVIVNVSSGGGEGLDGAVTRTVSSITGSQSVIGSYVFYYYMNLTAVSFPSCKTIGNSAFYSCTSLTTASFPACTSIGSYAFYRCSKLTTISFPVCKSIGPSAFYSCQSLTTASFPSCTSIGNSAFYMCRGITTASFPLCMTIATEAFRTCPSLTTAYFPVCTSIWSGVFTFCSSLLEVTVGTEYSSVCKLNNSNAFSGCDALTSIYVPASLLTAYQSATNWTYFSSKLVGV